MKYKYKDGGIVKLQNAWTTMPSVEDAILRAWANQSAKEKAEKQVASEKPKYTYVNPYDYLHGWREATEDAAKQDKYTVENLGGSKEEAEAAYNNVWENARKQLARTTATGLGTVALLGLSSGAAGPVAADIVNTGFGAHGLYNALSGNGIQKTVRLANQGDTWGTVKSGAGDLLDLSMGLHAAKLWGNLGKSMLAGQSLGNAYRGNVAGREMSNLVRSFNVSKNPFYSNPTVVSTIDHLYKEHPELATIGPKEAYGQYYKTIFPASKVQIPYAHGTRGNLSKGLEGSTKVSYTAAPETIGRNDFYLNLQPEASLQYADGIGVPEGFTWNKHRFWPLKEILGKPYKSDSWMFKPIQLRKQIPNRAGQFSRVKNIDGTYSGHGKLLEEYKAELGMQDLSDKEFLQRFGIKDGETFEQWVAENKQNFSDIYNSGNYHGLYHVKVDASNPLTINGGNTYYSERGIWDAMNAGKNDVLLHNNAANEFGSDVMVVKDVDPSKVRILGSDPDKQAFIDFMNGHNIPFTPVPQKPVSTIHFDGNMKTVSTPYEIENLGGGYMLKSLMRGNPLEKQIGKNGTVNVSNVRALIDKGNKVEKAVVDKVLASEEFAGKKSIDYNKFRKAVQDELITYKRSGNWIGNQAYADYGMKRIGFEVEPDEASSSLPGLVKGAKTDVVLYESPRIPEGSAKHYNDNTLGHSRTYTTEDEPDVLHVMESQSDWAQNYKPIGHGGVGGYAHTAEYNDKRITALKKRIERLNKEIKDEKLRLSTSKRIDGSTIESDWEKQQLREIIERDKKTLESARNELYIRQTPSEAMQHEYLADNYTTRQIQENLRYAAEKGQTKMRYPTRETAAKIEGYSKSRSQSLQDNPELQKHYDELRDALRTEENRIVKKYAPEDYLDESLREADFGDMGFSEEEIEHLIDRIRRSEEFERSANGVKMREEIIRARKEIDPDKWLRENVPEMYLPQHETILRKYDAFPKQFKKLYKNADVRIVTDSKGNTWYEVDVPKNYLQQEWAYKQGGILKGQHGILTPWYKAYNSKFGNTVRTFMFGKDYNLSNEEYQKKHGYAKPNELAMPWFTQVSAPGSIINLNKLGKVNLTLEPDKYWYVVHQTSSGNLPGIMKDGLKTGSGLNGTALNLSEDFLKAFQEGNLRAKGLLHKGSDAIVIGKFPKSKFPSGKLDDISEKLMDLGESSNFEVPTQYLRGFIKTQLKQGGILKAQK